MGISYENIDEDILNKEFINEVRRSLPSYLDSNDCENIIKIIKDSLVVDWYKRKNMKSEIKRSVRAYCLSNKKSLNGYDPEILVDLMVSVMNNMLKKHMLVGKGGE